jgi:uncharacterized membrane-anchored protein
MRAYNGTGPQVRGGGTVRREPTPGRGIPGRGIPGRGIPGRGIPGRAVRGEVVPKVPDVNPYFWAVKLLTTAMGEAVSDFLVKQYNPYLAVFASFVVFAIAIIWQFRVPTYRTWPYWTAVAMVAVFGTMVADAMHVGIGIPYKVSVIMFAISLAVVLVVWYRVEHTLSIHSITTPRREFFYWATVICTFALGTATGDLTAITLHLGYVTSGVVFALAICVPLAAWRLGANPVLTFWVAYILTRPIGASFADYFGMPKTSGGLGIGHGPVSLVTLALVVASIWYLSVTRKDAPSPVAAPVPAPAPAGGLAPSGRFGPAAAVADTGMSAGGLPEWGGHQGWDPQRRPGWEQHGRPGPDYYQQPDWDSSEYPDSPPDSSRWPG